MLIDILQQINEGRAEKGQGSKAGREKYTTPKGKKSSPVKARKSRVRIFNTIQDALKSSAPYGTIFSTKGADRLYVISRKKWGKDKESQVGVRIAKGFTPGSATPSASWPSIKAHSVRTMLKHGGSKSKRLTAKYGPGKKSPEEKRYAGKAVKESIKALHEALPLIPAAIAAVRGLGTRFGAKMAAKKGAKVAGKKAIVKKVVRYGPQARDPVAAVKKHTDLGGMSQKIAHTEYEGPSLSEFLSDLAVAATYDLGKKGLSYLLKKRQRRKEQVKPKSQNASTEHEGPSLREKISYLQLFRETVDLTPDEKSALKRGAQRRAGKSRANRRDRAKARQLLKKQKASGSTLPLGPRSRPRGVDPKYKKEGVPTPKGSALVVRKPDKEKPQKPKLGPTLGRTEDPAWKAAFDANKRYIATTPAGQKAQKAKRKARRAADDARKKERTRYKGPYTADKKPVAKWRKVVRGLGYATAGAAAATKIMRGSMEPSTQKIK